MQKLIRSDINREWLPKLKCIDLFVSEVIIVSHKTIITVIIF